ncbi:hypothetical protein PspLS_04774 [Pyricularia sp. CBS 133598]|nr:hypothetical protein PspLS_04774 [Pyricularia sp. CBS 133598]
MDHQAKASLSRGQAPSLMFDSSSPKLLTFHTSASRKPTIANTTLPPDSRNRRVVAVAASAAAVGMVIKLRADAIKKNEMAQKNSAVPNFYVSVERSGGGI